jgi:hypothetical protein
MPQWQNSTQWRRASLIALMTVNAPPPITTRETTGVAATISTHALPRSRVTARLKELAQRIEALRTHLALLHSQAQHIENLTLSLLEECVTSHRRI